MGIDMRAALLRIGQIHSDDHDDDGRHYCIQCGHDWPCPTFQVLEAVEPPLWGTPALDRPR
jgi:hypothetical protein